MSNYDPTTNQPFVRITGIQIFYPTSGLAQVTYDEDKALCDASGNSHILSDSPIQNSINIVPTDTTPLQIYNPTNGQAIPGQTTTVEQVLLGVWAIIHADQLARDAAASASAPVPATS